MPSHVRPVASEDLAAIGIDFYLPLAMQTGALEPKFKSADAAEQ